MAFFTLQLPDTSSGPEVPWDTEQQQAQWGFLVCLQAVSARGIKDFMPNPSQQRDWEEWADEWTALAGGWWVSKAQEPKWGGYGRSYSDVLPAVDETEGASAHKTSIHPHWNQQGPFLLVLTGPGWSLCFIPGKPHQQAGSPWRGKRQPCTPCCRGPLGS